MMPGGNLRSGRPFFGRNICKLVVYAKSLERSRLVSGKIRELPLLLVTWRVVTNGLFFAMRGEKFWEHQDLLLAIFTTGTGKQQKQNQHLLRLEHG